MDSDASLQQLARRYAAGELAWHDIAAEHDIAFGDLLLELGKQGLKLPLSGPLPSSKLWQLLLRDLQRDGKI